MKSKAEKSERRASTGSTKKHRDYDEEDELTASGSERRASEPPKLKKSRRAREAADDYEEAAEVGLAELKLSLVWSRFYIFTYQNSPPKKKKKTEKVKEEVGWCLGITR